jgi:hypothetical protein
MTRRQRKTRMELHASAFRLLGKRSARHSKTYLLLHTEVFQDGVVWTSSGHMQPALPPISLLRVRSPGPEDYQDRAKDRQSPTADSRASSPSPSCQLV